MAPWDYLQRTFHYIRGKKHKAQAFFLRYENRPPAAGTLVVTLCLVIDMPFHDFGERRKGLVYAIGR